MKKSKLGRVQFGIMQVLWRRGAATAREITDEMNREKPIAHSTVQTLLRKLEAKGAVVHDVVERTFVFRALSQESEVQVAAARELLARAFNNSALGLVAHLLKHEPISPQEMEQLRAMIETTQNENEEADNDNNNKA